MVVGVGRSWRRQGALVEVFWSEGGWGWGALCGDGGGQGEPGHFPMNRVGAAPRTGGCARLLMQGVLTKRARGKSRLGRDNWLPRWVVLTDQSCGWYQLGRAGARRPGARRGAARARGAHRSSRTRHQAERHAVASWLGQGRALRPRRWPIPRVPAADASRRDAGGGEGLAGTPHAQWSTHAPASWCCRPTRTQTGTPGLQPPRRREVTLRHSPPKA